MIGWLYAATLIGVALFGGHMALLLGIAVFNWRREMRRRVETAPDAWPHVLVQIPLFNERCVVDRAIAAAAALDYPRDRLHIQVLDDSTDDTPQRARACVARLAASGVSITHVHRRNRSGFKAGALAAGLALAPQAEFVAIFDADFVPHADLLKRLLPEFVDQPRLGLVQARWEHLNHDATLLTRAQALMFDGYFSVDQVARSAAGLLMNFNGSAGLWRRVCIDDAGGWQGDTLAEDLDLSYRAQLRGWRLRYRADVGVPAELPIGAAAFRQQQFRWAQGSFQVFGKCGAALALAPTNPLRKLLGFLHILGYLPHALLVASLLLTLPLMLSGGQAPINWDLLSALALVPPLTAVWGQWALAVFRGESPWRALKRIWIFPVLTLVFLGLAWSTTQALWGALTGKGRGFERTPKSGGGDAPGYAIRSDDWFLGEIALASYALYSAWIALRLAPNFVPVLLLYAASFGLIAVLGLRERRAAAQPDIELSSYPDL